MSTLPGANYPVTFDVDRPSEPRNRVTIGFRFVLIIPIAIVLAAVSGGISASARSSYAVAGSGGLLFAGPLLMILFRQKYPRWWFDWNVALWRFGNRVAAYALLLRDEYPATDDDQAVHLEVPYPDAKNELNRWLPLVKWFLAIPHILVLVFLNIGAVFAVIAAWFALLITGRYPEGLRAFVIGVVRWNNRVIGYALTLVTDQYPPFRLSEGSPGPDVGGR
ncbi:MAG: conserved hypothetical rane protein [Acidimicrobiia bacterium]|nr:conserved hypothetical rane protein [Acidimicrobiia bacterium]